MIFVKLIAKASPVHGTGCFAGQNISRGKVISFWGDKREVRLIDAQTHRRKLALGLRVTVETAVRLMGSWFVESIRIADKDPTDYINHSLQPNVGYSGGLLFVLKDIKKGQELFLDYRLLNADYEKNVVRGYSATRQLKASAEQVKKAFK